jgi:hypothetical protein
MDADILTEINKARADPTSLLTRLNLMKTYFNGNTYKEIAFVSEETAEGVTAVDDAIDYLTNTATVSSALTLEEGMSFSCRDHVQNMSATSNTGSIGEDGSTILQRANRYGTSTAAFV